MFLMSTKIDWDLIVVRFGEIGLKSMPVRSQFLEKLAENIRYSIKREGISDYDVNKTRGRVFVEVEDIDKVLGSLSYVSGVVSYSPAIKTVSEKSILLSEAFDVASKFVGEDDSFAVRTNRVGNHDYSSLDINEELGRRIEEEIGAKVDLDNPDKSVYLDVREDDAYIFKEKIDGLGGLPCGVQGSVVSLFSGGIDSPVAASRLVKRGCYVTPVYVGKGRFSSEEEFERVVEVAEKFSRYLPKEIELIFVDLEPVFEKIAEGGGRYSCILCRRAMYRVAEIIAVEDGYEGIVTGESLGQVASQTLSNIRVLEESISFPVYRPLIGFDKVETISISRDLGFFEVSSQDVGSCSILPDKVKTRADLDTVKKLEKNLGLVDEVEELVDDREYVSL